LSEGEKEKKPRPRRGRESNWTESWEKREERPAYRITTLSPTV